jgi:uncharacterized membrane protein
MSTALEEPTSTGLAPNLAGALAYVLGPLTGVLFLVLEKDNRFVRFHAMQSIVVGGAMIVASIALSIVSSILAFVPVLGWIIALAAGLGLAIFSLLLWIVLMVRAFRGREWEVPLVGGVARRYATPAGIAA